MRRIIPIAAAIALLSSPVIAQQSGPAAGGQFNNAQFRAQMAKYQPVLDLVTTVGLLPELEKTKATVLSKAQAAKLIPVLKDLQIRKDLKPADADKILTNIETKILSAAQLKQMDKIQLEREKQAEARRAAFQNRERPQNFQGRTQGTQANGQTTGRPQGSNGTQTQNGQRPTGPRNGMFEAIQAGKAYNPFTQEREAKILKDYLAVLAKK
jgi:hypothetical protein